MQKYERYTPEQLYEDECASGPLRVADEQLKIIEERVGAGAESVADRRERIDTVLVGLVRDTVSAFSRGELPFDKAGSMLLIAVEKIDEYKDDDDPRTNGERIAAALAQAPVDLLEGPLRDFAMAEGNDELMDVLSEISRYPAAQTSSNVVSLEEQRNRHAAGKRPDAGNDELERAA